MTDNELARINAICKVAHIDDIGDLSDGFHTFNDLYYQRCMLFAAIVKQNKAFAWKSHKHEDGEPCFGGGWFIVGVDTPEGSYTFHYEDKYWDMFDCKEIRTGKHWDGHTDKDVKRLFSLPTLPVDYDQYLKTSPCSNCPAFSDKSNDCTRNPYTEGCLDPVVNEHWETH